MRSLPLLLLAAAWPPAHLALSPRPPPPPGRGTTTVDGAGFGIDRPAELSKEDDEYEAFRKRMMLAYRFRPNPLVCVSLSPPTRFLAGLPRISAGGGSAGNRAGAPSSVQLGQVSLVTPHLFTCPPLWRM